MWTPYDAIFRTQAAGQVSPALLEAIARTESSLNPNQKVWEPKVGEYSYGLMGILESTARGLGYTGPADGLKDPMINIALGAQLAGEIIQRQGGLILTDFYSEWNSGRPSVWEQSTQVATNVLHFLNNYLVAIGQAAAGSIDDAMRAIGSAGAAAGIGLPELILGSVLLLFYFKGRSHADH